jgi:glycosyltransferase EpsD
MLQSKKKVLFTSHTANFSKFNRPFMRWFKDQGYKVHYASMGEEEVLDCDKHFTVPFTRSPFKFSNIIAYRQLKKIIDTEDYDIIHTHTPMGSVVTRLAARAARKKGTRVFYTAHGFHFFTGAPILNWLIYYPVEKYMARFADMLITINREDFLRAKRDFATDVRYVPGVGVDLSRFQPVDEVKKTNLRKKYGFNKEDFILVYVAELNENKNQEFLIEQIKSLSIKIPNLKLLLCGDGEMRESYVQMVKRLHLEDKVIFTGYRKDIEELLASSDVFVSSSIREGLGISLIEAMAVGLSLIASKNRGHADVITHGENGFLYRTNDGREFSLYVQRTYSAFKETKNMNTLDVKKYSVERALESMTVIYNESKHEPH